MATQQQPQLEENSRTNKNNSTTTNSTTTTTTTTTQTNQTNSNKLIRTNGRPKVNTLPPWAKSHEDDDQLFQSTLSVPPIPIFNSPRPPHPQHRTHNPTASSSKHPPPQSLSQPSSTSPRSKDFSKLERHSVSTSTLVPDSPSLEDDWNQIRHQLQNQHHFSSTQLATQFNSSQPSRGQLSPFIDHGSSATNTQNNPSPSTRKPVYRSMTSPTPVFQRFRPLITVNGQKKRTTEDGLNLTEQSDLQLDPTPTPSSSRQNPDDRWWQFTLPTKYRRKVEDYLNRGSLGIRGVHHLDDPPSEISSSGSPMILPRMEMVEIDEDRRKILALLKQHAPPYGTRRSSVEFNDPQYEFHSYGPIPEVSPSQRHSHDYFARSTTPHPPTDFPLPAFSRKLSLTPLQQEQYRQPLGAHSTLGKNPFDESPCSLKVPHTGSYTLSTPHYSTGAGHDHRSRAARFGFYFMHHPTAPLLCRLINFILTASSLAICATIRKLESRVNLHGILGSSTVFILVVAPLGLLHNLFAIYCEYFGAPIGIWSVSWKMFHTLSELVFVSLWSAGLALSMNDKLRSPLGCGGGMGVGGVSRWVLRANGTVPGELAAKMGALTEGKIGGPALAQLAAAVLDFRDHHALAALDPPLRLRICHLQASLVAIIFPGLALYTALLVVSLFRIFLKVSRKY